MEGWSLPAGQGADPDRAAQQPVSADDGPDWLVENLLTFWRQALRRSDLDADANFFTSGGTSLLGAMLVQRIRKSVGVGVKLADLFANPTPNLLAARVSELLPY
jgi:aryl carrier-like protein